MRAGLKCFEGQRKVLQLEREESPEDMGPNANTSS